MPGRAQDRIVERTVLQHSIFPSYQYSIIPSLFMSNIPADLKYAKSHEWVRLSGEIATVGITDHAQHELTDVVFVELPEVGRKLKAGDACAVVESVKTASDIYSPVSGEVTEVNKAIVNDPALVNSDPYSGGWFYKMKLANPSELNTLIGPDQYKAQIGGS
jgi:glycine cleavage system H protein